MNHVSKKYIEIALDEGDARKNEWFEYCLQQRVPYVTVTVHVNVADVSWDHISCPIEAERLLDHCSDFIHQSAVAIFEKYSNEYAEYSISSRNIVFEGVLLEDARRAAVEVFELIDGLFENKPVI